MGGQLVDDGTGEHEPKVSAAAVLVVRETLGEQSRTFAVVDATETQEKRALVEPERVAHGGFGSGAGVDAEPDHERGFGPDLEAAVDDVALGFAPVRERGGGFEQRAVQRQAYDGLVVRGGVEDRARAATCGRPATVGWYRYGWNANASASLCAIAAMRPGATGP